MDSKDDMAVAHMQKNINGLEYESLPETTVAVSRIFKRQFFQRGLYNPGDEAVCDWNTGAEFVNPRRSWLVFRVSVDSQFITSLGRGSAMNFIQRIVVTTRSGVELSRTENFNILSSKLLRYHCPTQFLEQNGQAFGYVQGGGALPAPGIGTLASGTAVTYAIPIWMLSGFFQGDGKSLLPPQLAAGLRVQLTFAPFAQAAAAISPPIVGPPAVPSPTTYVIDQVSFLLNSTALVDSWQKSVNEESAREGLTYSYTEWHNTQTSSASGSNTVNIEVRKAAARALYAFTVSQFLGQDPNTDNMASMTYSVNNFEWRLGSMYPTQQPITNNPEAYFVAQSTMDGGMVDCERYNAVGLSDFNGTGTPLVPLQGGDGIVSVSLERNDVDINGVLNISGAPTNNSRLLAVNINFTPPTAPTQIQHYLYMAHLRVVKAFLDNAVVSE